MAGPRKRAAIIAVLLPALTFTGCSTIPTDAESSLEEARGGQLHVGAAHHPPYVDITGEDPQGSEVGLIEDYAATIDAEIRWVVDSETLLVGQLKEGQLDIVIGGFDDATLWTTQVAMTRPYTTDPDGTGRVIFTEPGENALLVDLETFLLAREQRGQR